MVKVYGTDIRKLPDPREVPELLWELTEERRERTLRYRQPEDRKRSLGAGLLLAKILPCYGVSPEAVRRGEDGKPHVEGCCFNLSHSGDVAVCAVGVEPVGCDVEKIAGAPRRVAERFFHRNEAAYLRQCGEAERDTLFFRFWTMKESYLKMTGEGMRLSLDRIEFRIEPEGIRVFRDGGPLPCHIQEYALPEYRIAVCSREDQFAETVEYVEIG